MANDKTDYLEAAVIDYFLRPGAAAPHRPTSVKVALLTVDSDSEAPTVTEASYAGYAALDAGFGASSQNAGLARTSNAGTLTFAAVAGGPITVVALGIKDDAGNWLYVKTLSSSVTYQTGDIPQINAAALTVDEG
jgi:hypothetical protein